MTLEAQQQAVRPAKHLDVKLRDPNRRPLLVDKSMFFRMQATQRLAHARPNFPNIDLALFGTAALRIVFALPDADQKIIRQVLQDLATATDEFSVSPLGASDS